MDYCESYLVSLKRALSSHPYFWLSFVTHVAPRSPPGSSVHGILQARILKWTPFPSQEDLPNQRIKPRCPVLQQILYHLCRQGSPLAHINLPTSEILYICTQFLWKFNVSLRQMLGCCYGSQCFIPPKSYTEILIPKMMV